MISVYKKYLIKKFIKKIGKVSIIFLSLIIVLNTFDEISFFSDLEVNFLFPFILTLSNSPSILFEIFPFIFLISALLFFLDLINLNELEVFKVNGLDNLKIIKILFFTSVVVGLFLIVFYYSFSSKLKFIYLELKSNYTTDGKYLAMINENGIWIKDEIYENIYIINAKKMEKNELKDVVINQFDIKFRFKGSIISRTVDITNNEWLIFDPIATDGYMGLIEDNTHILNTNFNVKKINQMFSDLSSLNILELIKLSDDYERLGYSSTQVRSHLSKIYSYPVYLALMALFSSIIMLNIKKNKPMIFYLILSIFLSVVIYYFNIVFNLLGETGKIPVYASTWMPIFILIIIISIGLIRINEK
jgi:lipopolysaccharide export system permease protein